MTSSHTPRDDPLAAPAQQEAHWLTQTAQQLDEATPPFDAAANLRRVHARIQAEGRPLAPPGQPREWRSVRGLAGWWRTLWPPILAYGLGAATAAWVLTVGLPIAPSHPGAAVVPLGGSEAPAVQAETVRLQVVFRNTASAEQIRALLVPLSAQVVAGPSRLGVWELVVPASQARAAVHTLRASTLVEHVAP